MRLRMFEVQELMLDGGGKILVPFRGGIDALVPFLGVTLFVHSYQSSVEIGFGVCPAEFVIDDNPGAYTFFERFSCLHAVLPHVLQAPFMCTWTAL